MKRVLTALVFIVLLIGLVGCEETGKETVSSMPAGSDSGAADGAGGDALASAEPADEGSDDSFIDKFADFAGKKWNLEYTVDYDMTSKSGGQTQRMGLKQYFGGEGRIRSDMTVQGMETRTFILTDGIYSCNNNQGQWMCMDFGAPEDLEEQDRTLAFQDAEKAPDEYDITYAGTMVVAGTTAHCYGIAMPTGKLKECFSKEGVPLYMEVSSEGFESIMKATSYKTSVSSGDFKLPAEPVDMQDMMNQQMEQMQANMPKGYEMPDMSDYQ